MVFGGVPGKFQEIKKKKKEERTLQSQWNASE
jgi:hypothetical protein